MLISEDQRDPNFNKGNHSKPELGAGFFIAYCLISTILCFLMAIFLLPAAFWGEPKDWWTFAFFLSIVPGILIGAIIYNTQKHSSSNNNQTATVQNNQPAPVQSKQEAPGLNNNSVNVSDKLMELKNLHDQDLITDDEFDKLKKEILKNF